MSEDTPTPEEVRASIIPKSDQMNADDLVTGPITVEITKVRVTGDKKQPIIVELEGQERPYKPCKTMRRVLVAIFTDDARQWIGQRVTLFCDPEVVYMGIKVGGIRISHASALKAPETLILTKKRGEREEFTIYPIETLSPEDVAYVLEIKEEIANADTEETLRAIGFILKQKSSNIQSAVREAYGKRLRELRTGEKQNEHSSQTS